MNVNRFICYVHTYIQLQCTIKDEWVWDFICKTWLNHTNCYRNENNIIQLTSFVKHEYVEKMKESNTDCLFFLKAYSHYTNQCKCHKIHVYNYKPIKSSIMPLFTCF